MPQRLFRLYQRKRIVNINANVVAAGLLALIPTAIVVHLVELRWPASPGWVFPVVAVGADIFWDVTLYFGLHWLANHWRPFAGRTEAERQALAAKPPPFMQDATLVQLERAILSPLYYLTAAGLMKLLQLGDVRPGLAVLIAFPTGLILTRVLHTVWGLRSGSFLDHDERERRRNGNAQQQPAAAPAQPGADAAAELAPVGSKESDAA
ncbi:MAG: hypothetical protein ACF8R7_16520 [Phycisphaerales bacterium JB039]